MWCVLLGTLATGCRGAITCPTPATSVTYQDVAPIFEAKCNGCHATYRTGASRYGAPDHYNYDTYEAASSSASRTAEAVIGGSMPYGGAMSDHDACTIQAWVDAGAPL